MLKVIEAIALCAATLVYFVTGAMLINLFAVMDRSLSSYAPLVLCGLIWISGAASAMTAVSIWRER